MCCCTFHHHSPTVYCWLNFLSICCQIGFHFLHDFTILSGHICTHSNKHTHGYTNEHICHIKMHMTIDCCFELPLNLMPLAFTFLLLNHLPDFLVIVSFHFSWFLLYLHAVYLLNIESAQHLYLPSHFSPIWLCRRSATVFDCVLVNSGQLTPAQLSAKQRSD